MRFIIISKKKHLLHLRVRLWFIYLNIDGNGCARERVRDQSLIQAYHTRTRSIRERYNLRYDLAYNGENNSPAPELSSRLRVYALPQIGRRDVTR